MAAQDKRNRYEGKYVAMASFNSKEIIAAGKELDEVCRKAERKGCNSPVVVFVPKNGRYFL